MTAESFSLTLEGLFRAMRRARGRWAALPEALGPLTPSQFLLVVPLLGEAPLSVRELAEGAGIAAPTATRTLDALEAQGLIVRRHSLEDRRSVLVELTDDGRKAVVAARAVVRERRKALYEALEPGERDDAERLLRRLTEIFDRA